MNSTTEKRSGLTESPDGLPRLDRAVALAAERGIKLILALSNSLPDFGGMDEYNRWLSPGATLCSTMTFISGKICARHSKTGCATWSC